MRLQRIVCALLFFSPLLWGACAKGSQPASPVSQDSGESEGERSCEALEERVRLLYLEAARQDGVVANLQSEFVSANLTMAMNDCKLRPAARVACLQKVKNVKELEAECLDFLDDQGTVEGYRFAGSASQ